MTATAAPTLSSAQLRVSVEEIKARRGPAPWGERIVINDPYGITLICQTPGHQNDWHYHLADECWYIY
ncbi:MAG: hypothetical protein ACTHMA_06685, partial [Thermomicrobiales bacterium]